MSLIGSLEDTRLADVLRLFGQGRKSGRLLATNDDNQTTLRFDKGALVHAHTARGRLDGEEALFDLFGWREGQLTFIAEEKTVTPNVRRGLEELIEEGGRVGETLHRMNALVPNDRVAFQMTTPPDDAAPASLTARDFRVLRLLDGSRDVRDVLEATRLPRSEVLKLLFELSEKGYLERVDAARSLRAVPQGLFGKEAAEIDTRIEEEWKRLLRYGQGVFRVEVRGGAAGRAASLPVSFRSGLIREVQLPRAVLSELGLREGDDVQVKPLG
jgi:DNA-binding MarR family transcriptional regulator